MEKIYSRNPDVVFRKIAEEYILVPIKKKVAELDSIYTLNEVSARIWELIDGKTSSRDLINTITREFCVTSEEAQKDILQFLSQLEEAEVIQPIIKPCLK